MSNATWTAVDRWLEHTLDLGDPDCEHALTLAAQANLPEHQVSYNQGRFLQVLIHIGQCRRVLEIGTLGGFSTLMMAQAVGDKGYVHSLEVDQHHWQVAQKAVQAAQLDERIHLHLGPAETSLETMLADTVNPFDLIFIDADKPSNPRYLQLALQLSKPGTIIVGDNVIRDGALADDTSTDAKVIGVQTYLRDLAVLNNVCTAALQTVGNKGYDGFSLSVVTSDTP